MMHPRKGIRVPLSPARKMVVELLHHARKVPSLPLSKRLNIPAVAHARRAARPRPSWTAVFMRAFALVARNNPELRRAFIPWPWPHLYQHPCSECAVLVERFWQGEPVILGSKIRAPESLSLVAIDSRLRYLRETPVEQVSDFRQILRLGRLPGFFRRFTFWHTLYLSGFKRAKRLGTFMLSSLGAEGVEQHHPLTPLTTYLTFGPVTARGRVTVKMVYDHRVMDGRVVARCLNALEQELLTSLLTELRGLEHGRNAAKREKIRVLDEGCRDAL